MINGCDYRFSFKIRISCWSMYSINDTAKQVLSFQFTRLTMPSFLEKDIEYDQLNRSWGACYALCLKADVGIQWQSPNAENLDFEIVNRWLFESMHNRLPQLQHQIKHHLQSRIPTIAAYVEETSIYFLQFMMENVHTTCIFSIGSSVGTVFGDSSDAIAAFWNQILWSSLSLQKKWKLKTCLTVKPN